MQRTPMAMNPKLPDEFRVVRAYMVQCDECNVRFERDEPRQRGQFLQCRECWENESRQVHGDGCY